MSSRALEGAGSGVSSGGRVVVKCGGSSIGPAGRESLAALAEGVAALASAGMLPVVVHGGGPQIGEMLRRVGKQPQFRDGLRVTDAETLEIARMVLVGAVNRDIVGALNASGLVAVGLSGEDARSVTARRREPQLGYVGDVSTVDTSLLEDLLAAGRVPVVATIAVDGSGQPLNVNADTFAAAVAVALGAERLVLLTDVDGIRADSSDPGSRIPALSADEIDGLLEEGALTGGMLPKARACAHAVRHGVARAHVLDGRGAEALLGLLRGSSAGTVVTGETGGTGAVAAAAAAGREVV